MTFLHRRKTMVVVELYTMVFLIFYIDQWKGVSRQGDTANDDVQDKTFQLKFFLLILDFLTLQCRNPDCLGLDQEREL